MVEVADDDVADVTKTFEQHHVTCHRIGHSVAGSDVRVSVVERRGIINTNFEWMFGDYQDYQGSSCKLPTTAV